MIVRFRLTKEVGSGDAAESNNTQTKVQARYISGQTIDTWNTFKYALNSKLLKKSSKEIKNDMLRNTKLLLEALDKAIETPEDMTDQDVNGLTAHIACMMAYTQAIEKLKSSSSKGATEKDGIRNAVGTFHKSFDTAWRYVCPVHP